MRQKLKEAAQLKKDLGLEIPNSETVSGAMSTAAVSSMATSALDDGQSKALIKGIRKKNMDPESMKLREQKLKENKLLRESDNYYNA